MHSGLNGMDEEKRLQGSIHSLGVHRQDVGAGVCSS